MNGQTMIIIGGIYALAFVAFHALFWRLFDWKNELPKLNGLGAAVMQVLNLCLMLCLVLFGYVSLFHAPELVTTGLGRTLLVFMALFWLARAVEQLVFFSYRRPVSIAMTILFLAGSFLYAYPWVSA